MRCDTCGSYVSYSGGCNGEWECSNPRCGEETTVEIQPDIQPSRNEVATLRWEGWGVGDILEGGFRSR